MNLALPALPPLPFLPLRRHSRARFVLAGLLAALLVSPGARAADPVELASKAMAEYFDAMRQFAPIFQRETLSQAATTPTYRLVVARGPLVGIGTIYDEENLGDPDLRCVLPAAALPPVMEIRDVPEATRVLDLAAGATLPPLVSWLFSAAKLNVNVKRTVTFSMRDVSQQIIRFEQLQEQLRGNESCQRARAGRDVLMVRGVVKAREHFVVKLEGGGGIQLGNDAVGAVSANVKPSVSGVELSDKEPKTKFYVVSRLLETDRGSTLQESLVAPDDALLKRFEAALARPR